MILIINLRKIIDRVLIVLCRTLATARTSIDFIILLVTVCLWFKKQILNCYIIFQESAQEDEPYISALFALNYNKLNIRVGKHGNQTFN